MLLSSRLSNIQTLTLIGITLLTITNTLYYTINTLRIREEERSKAQPRAVRKAIKEEICIVEGNVN